MAFKFKQSSASLYGFEAKIYLHSQPSARLLTELRADIKNTGVFKNLYIKKELDFGFAQNRVFTAYDTETARQGYTLLNFGTGGYITQKGKILFSVYLSMNNITDVAYQNLLSRLKYTVENNVTRRNGVFNMGLNFSVKVNVPFGFKVK